MHDFSKVDATRFTAHEYAHFWAAQQRQQRRLEAQTRTALNSARRVQ